jgi:hypothetical protein
MDHGALGIIRGCMDPAAKSGDFYGPEASTGFPKSLVSADFLHFPTNIRTN